MCFLAQPKLKAQLAKKPSKEGLEAAIAEFTPEQAKIKAKLEQSAVPLLPPTPAEDPVITTPLPRSLEQLLQLQEIVAQRLSPGAEGADLAQHGLHLAGGQGARLQETEPGQLLRL